MPSFTLGNGATLQCSRNPARALAEWIDMQKAILGQEWVESLEQRKREEAIFHDDFRADHGRSERPSNHRFYAATSKVDDYINAWTKRWAAVDGATFLDYACGDGKRAIAAARGNASLAVGIDVSETSIRKAIDNAERAGVSERTRFLQRDCEDTGLASDSFSSAICSSVLHHLDLSRAFPELSRVMVPGGRILCVEALSYNPIIQLYRKQTPQLRTAWETSHILNLRDVEFSRRWFTVENLRFFLMAAPLATLAPAGSLRDALLWLGNAIDAFATRIPGVRRLSWQFAFELVKPR